jgi:hypothetical protein
MFAASLSHASDLKFTERSTSYGTPARTNTTYIGGRRTRHETRSLSEYQAWRGGPRVSLYGHRFATISQCDKNLAIRLDLDANEYDTYEIDDQGRPKRTAASMPMPVFPYSERSGGVLNIYVDDVDTGERKTMFGYTARHSVQVESRVPGPGAVSQPQKIERDGWYIDDLDFPEGCPPVQFGRPQRFSYGLLTAVRAGSTPKIDRVEIHHTGVPETGFPVELTTTTIVPERVVGYSSPAFVTTPKMEVTELSTAPLDPVVFELPSGFKKVNGLGEQPPQPPSSALLRIWAWVRQSISQIGGPR